MEHFFARSWDMLLGRLSGPLSFRFLMQPAVTANFGIIAGIRDAQAGRPVFFYELFTNKQHRRARLRETWSAIWKVFFVAVVLDLVYELLVLKAFYFGSTLIVAVVLTVIPYMLVRGPANRIARLWIRRPPPK